MEKFKRKDVKDSWCVGLISRKMQREVFPVRYLKDAAGTKRCFVLFCFVGATAFADGSFQNGKLKPPLRRAVRVTAIIMCHSPSDIAYDSLVSSIVGAPLMINAMVERQSV